MTKKDRAEKMRFMYVESRLTLDEVSKSFGLSRERVRQILLKEFGIKGMGNGQLNPDPRGIRTICRRCGVEYYRKRKGTDKNTLCSIECPERKVRAVSGIIALLFPGKRRRDLTPEETKRYLSARTIQSRNKYLEKRNEWRRKRAKEPRVKKMQSAATARYYQKKAIGLTKPRKKYDYSHPELRKMLGMK